jgi:SAM-dependent methyltransferase
MSSRSAIKAIAAAVILLLALIWFLPAQDAGTGAFHLRDSYYIPWDGLQVPKGIRLDVPYAATPYEIADEMVRLAGIGPDDVVYDLGCGDGRLVIEAVRRTGCRGVGIDIDPARIRQSRQNAAVASVADRVRFVEQNFFETDLREASVVLIYLFPDVNLKLRPKFLDELRPGSRLVSHAFDMGEWRPDQSTRIRAQGIHFWRIPANATGVWRWEPPGGGKVPCTLEMEQRFQRLRGTLTLGGRKSAITDAALVGDRISFRVAERAAGRTVMRDYAGTIRGNAIAGTVTSTGGGQVQTGRWKAVRDPSTSRPVDEEHRPQDLQRN